MSWLSGAPYLARWSVPTLLLSLLGGCPSSVDIFPAGSDVGPEDTGPSQDAGPEDTGTVVDARTTDAGDDSGTVTCALPGTGEHCLFLDDCTRSGESPSHDDACEWFCPDGQTLDVDLCESPCELDSDCHVSHDYCCDGGIVVRNNAQQTAAPDCPEDVACEAISAIPYCDEGTCALLFPEDHRGCFEGDECFWLPTDYPDCTSFAPSNRSAMSTFRSRYADDSERCLANNSDPNFPTCVGEMCVPL